MMIRTTISRISFWIAILFLVALLIGLVGETLWQQLIFEDYFSTLLTYAFIFAVINALTRLRRQ